MFPKPDCSSESPENCLEKSPCLRSEIIRHKALKSVVCCKLPMVTDGANVLTGLTARSNITFVITNSISGHLKFSANCLYHYLGFKSENIYHSISSILTTLYIAFITAFLTSHQRPSSGYFFMSRLRVDWDTPKYLEENHTWSIGVAQSVEYLPWDPF